MNKKDLVLNNLQWLMCHKTKPISYGNPVSMEYSFINIILMLTLARNLGTC